jgi:hypothetical protein
MSTREPCGRSRNVRTPIPIASPIAVAAGQSVRAGQSGDHKTTMSAPDYLHHFSMPNFYFHATTAYAILRHNGLEIGKSDFMGSRTS